MKPIYQSSLLTFGVFSSKLISYILSYFIASKYGVTLQSDTILFYFALPDLIITLLLSNSIEVIISPYFKSNTSKDSILGVAIKKMLPVSLTIGIIFLILKQEVFQYLAPGFYKTLLSISFIESMLIALSISIVPIIKTIKAYNNIQSKLFFTSFEVVIFNIALLFILLLDKLTLSSIIATLSIAMILRLFFVAIPNIKKLCFQSKAELRIYTKQNLTTVIHCFLISLLSVALPVLVRSKSSLLGEGSFSLVSYILKLSELPLGIWGIITSALLIPIFARKEKSYQDLRRWLLIAGGLGVLATITTIALNMVIQHYSFSIQNLSANQLKLIFSNLSLLSIGIFCRFPTLVLQLYFLLKKQNKILVYIQITTIIIIAIIYKVSSFESIHQNIVFMNSVYIANFTVYLLAFIYDRKNIIS